MEEIKQFTKSTKGKFKEPEMTIQNISGKNNLNYSNDESSLWLLEILKDCISNPKKRTDRKR